MDKYLQDNTSTPNERNDNNTFISDISINSVFDDNLLFINNHLNTKNPLIGIPIKNFLKIKDPDIAISKCQSDRNRSSNKVKQ